MKLHVELMITPDGEDERRIAAPVRDIEIDADTGSLEFMQKCELLTSVLGATAESFLKTGCSAHISRQSSESAPVQEG